MKKQYRNNGAIGALLDEYEKAILELILIFQSITKEELVKIIDTKTKDPDCKSTQTILSHIIGSGYNYAIVIRKSLGEVLDYKEVKLLDSVDQYRLELKKMFQYNVQLFEDYPSIKIEEHKNKNKILGRWGQLYDVEQLMEHAIVHVLRHRRQIEHFLQN